MAPIFNILRVLILANILMYEDQNYFFLAYTKITILKILGTYR